MRGWGVVVVVLLTGQAMLRPVSAGDLFVDQKHPAASDDNPGTEAKPFKTIQPAVKPSGAGGNGLRQGRPLRRAW